MDETDKGATAMDRQAGPNSRKRHFLSDDANEVGAATKRSRGSGMTTRNGLLAAPEQVFSNTGASAGDAAAADDEYWADVSLVDLNEPQTARMLEGIDSLTLPATSAEFRGKTARALVAPEQVFSNTRASAGDAGAADDEYWADDQLAGLTASQEARLYEEIDRFSSFPAQTGPAPGDGQNTMTPRVASSVNDEYWADVSLVDLNEPQTARMLEGIDSLTLPATSAKFRGETARPLVEQPGEAHRGSNEDAFSIDYPDSSFSDADFKPAESGDRTGADGISGPSAKNTAKQPYRMPKKTIDSMIRKWRDKYLIPGNPDESGRVEYHSREEYRLIYGNNILDIEDRAIIFKSLDDNNIYLPRNLFRSSHKEAFEKAMEDYCLSNKRFSDLVRNGYVLGPDGQLVYRPLLRMTPGGLRPQRHEYEYPVQAGADNPDLLVRRPVGSGEYRFTAMWANREGILTPEDAVGRFGKGNVWCKRVTNAYIPLDRYNELVKSLPGAKTTALDNAFRAYWKEAPDKRQKVESVQRDGQAAARGNDISDSPRSDASKTTDEISGHGGEQVGMEPRRMPARNLAARDRSSRGL